jgi:hypothetical protein
MQDIKIKRLRETETAVVVVIGKAVKIFSKNGQMYRYVCNLLSD